MKRLEVSLALVLSLSVSSSLPGREVGWVRVEARDDATGRLDAGSLYLKDGSGLPRTQDGMIAYEKGSEHHFVAPGRLELELPPGDYRLMAERGTEYLPESVDLAIRSGMVERRTIRLKR